MYIFLDILNAWEKDRERERESSIHENYVRQINRNAEHVEV
jgi:hypothetical protein